MKQEKEKNEKEEEELAKKHTKLKKDYNGWQ